MNQNTATANAQASVEYQKETIFNGEGFSIKYVIESQWNNEYIANVTITNTGNDVIENWELSYESTDEYSNIWNGKVAYHSAKNYNIKNAEYNQNINPGESVSFGFQASFTNNKIQVPTSYKLLGDKLIVSNRECNATFNIQSQWNTGAILNVTLYNNSDENIEDWSMQFDFDYKIDNIWRAKIEKQNNKTYSLKNCGYNATIRPKESETFGMQISFNEGVSIQNPTNVTVSQYKKDMWYLDFDKEWNRTMIHADDSEVIKASQKNKNTIKVGLIDSGVDCSSNINVVESENFVEEYTETNPIFEDLSGHGTAVAGLLASDSTNNSLTYKFEDSYLQKLMSEKIDGVNPYVNIYSAGVLDENNKTTVDRMVAGIEWAIEKNVNILSISCGLDNDSTKLHNAIKKAYEKGILIVAAAGNEGKVQYPAKYSEVMAVGSVKCNGQQAVNGAIGNEIEVVAPGEDVTTYGPFGIITSQSGSSMAAPQVTALAAILWQQDLTKSNEFIRQLIDSTARAVGDRSKYGYGLIDCAYALQQYGTFASKFANNKAIALDSIVNNNATLFLTDESEVKGYWNGTLHSQLAGKLETIKKGAIWPDNENSNLQSMTHNPPFHGYYKADYIKAYMIMTKVASKMYSSGKWMSTKNQDAFTKKLVKQIKEAASYGFQQYGYKSKEDKANFIYGMSLHTVADIFAHSTMGIKGDSLARKDLVNKKVGELKSMRKRLTHGPTKTGGGFYSLKNFADMRDCIPRRYNISAVNVCNAIIDTAVTKHKAGSKKVFSEISYYISCATAKKYKSSEKKKAYLLNSYGILKLSTYLKPGKDKDLIKVVNNASNKKIEEVIKEWK